MAANSCLLRNTFPWLAAIGSFLAFSLSFGFGFFTIFLASSALILCPVIASRSKSCTQTPSILEEEEVEEEEEESVGPTQEVIETSGQSEAKEKEDDTQKEEKKGGEYLLSSSEALSDSSDSESIDQTTSSTDEDSENDWIFRERNNSQILNQSHNTLYSDGSISDEESLIEIDLPGSINCGLQQQKWQQNWIEMLNEMYEEENLIEIDICMGSIKCSRFEIEA